MVDKPAELGELDSASAQIQSGMGRLTDLESQIQELTERMQGGDASASQADMIRLQSLIAKHNESVDMLSSLAKKRSDAMASIVANMR